MFLLVPKSRIHERQRESAPSAQSRRHRHLVGGGHGPLGRAPTKTPEIVYVLVDNRIIIDENTTVEELSREDVARVASFNIKVFGDTKMSNSTVVDELVDLFQSYDLVAVQEIKDIDEEVPFLFLDELNDVDGQGDVINQTLLWNMVLSREEWLARRRQKLSGAVRLLLQASRVPPHR